MGAGKERDVQDAQPFVSSNFSPIEDFSCGNSGQTGNSGNSQCSSGNSRSIIEQAREITGQTK